MQAAPRTAIILARLSDLRDDDERGVDGQVQDGHDYARRIDWGIGPRLSHVIIENNETGNGLRGVSEPTGGRAASDRRLGLRGCLSRGQHHPRDRRSSSPGVVEGCVGAGRSLADWLVTNGETVLDVPARLAAQVRVYPAGRAAGPSRTTRSRSGWLPWTAPAFARSFRTATWSACGCRGRVTMSLPEKRSSAQSA